MTRLPLKITTKVSQSAEGGMYNINEIRRNLDLKFEFDSDEEYRKAIMDLFMPKVTESLKREICDKIMAHCVATWGRDCDGNLITPETHEVDCDIDFTIYEGEQWAYPKQWYVRPKKSEYEK